MANYQSNNRGKLPTTLTAWQAFEKNYLTPKLGANVTAQTECTTEEFCDPDGYYYYVKSYTDISNAAGATEASTTNAALTWNTNKYQIYVYAHAQCGTEDGQVVYSDNARHAAFVARLESGIYCGQI